MKTDLLATKSDTLEVLDIILKLQTIFKEVKEKNNYTTLMTLVT